MAIIIGIIGIILFIALFSALISLIKWLFKAALYAAAIGVVVFGSYAAYTALGLWLLPIVAAVGLIWVLIRFTGPESLAATVKKVFRDCEMASYAELLQKVRAVRSVDSAELRAVVAKYVEQGKLDTLKFRGQEPLYRWTESRSYRNGVQTKHLRID